MCIRIYNQQEENGPDLQCCLTKNDSHCRPFVFAATITKRSCRIALAPHVSIVARPDGNHSRDKLASVTTGIRIVNPLPFQCLFYGCNGWEYVLLKRGGVGDG